MLHASKFPSSLGYKLVCLLACKRPNTTKLVVAVKLVKRIITADVADATMGCTPGCHVTEHAPYPSDTESERTKMTTNENGTKFRQEKTNWHAQTRTHRVGEKKMRRQDRHAEEAEPFDRDTGSRTSE